MQRKSFFGLGMLLVAVAVAALLVMNITRPAKAKTTESEKIVAVVKPTRSDLTRTLQLTAEMRPWQEVDIHAKVAGYLKNIKVDIGDRVKAGEIIATLEIPEEQQDQAKAKADYQVAKLDYDRTNSVLKAHPGLLAQQDLDKVQGTYEEAKAAYERTNILANYGVITAPFNGVITKRFADPGALVQAGTASNTQAMPLVHLADENKLRLDFPVPESDVTEIAVGMPVTVRMDAVNESIHSAIARMSDKVDTATRTMDAEVDLDNHDGHLKPGMYATAVIDLETKANALALPVQAIAGGDKPTVWVVNAQNILEERPVTIGIQMPDKIEITSGILDGDQVVYGNRNSLSLGAKVKPKLMEAAKE